MNHVGQELLSHISHGRAAGCQHQEGQSEPARQTFLFNTQSIWKPDIRRVHSHLLPSHQADSTVPVSQGQSWAALQDAHVGSHLKCSGSWSMKGFSLLIRWQCQCGEKQSLRQRWDSLLTVSLRAGFLRDPIVLAWPQCRLLKSLKVKV